MKIINIIKQIIIIVAILFTLFLSYKLATYFLYKDDVKQKIEQHYTEFKSFEINTNQNLDSIKSNLDSLSLQVDTVNMKLDAIYGVLKSQNHQTTSFWDWLFN